VVPTSSPGTRFGGSGRPSRGIGKASLRSIIDEARKLPLASAAILIFGFLFQVALRHQAQPYLTDGHQREWFSSETLMQTVSILDLREAPVESLTHIHIQPPGFDLVRAILVHLWPSLDIHAALKQVDHALYFLWSILYCVCGLLMFRWLSGLVGKDNCLSCLALVPAPSRRPGVFNAIGHHIAVRRSCSVDVLLLVEAETRIFLHLRGHHFVSVVVLLQVSLSTPLSLSYGCFSILVEGAVAHGGALLADNWRNLWVLRSEAIRPVWAPQHILV
jgi:hypothetical protein